VDDLLSIGEFSRRCGISPSRLRTYADAGILTAAAVDADSGYRYYSPTQLDQARIIDLLRSAAIPVAEIRSFLDQREPDALDRWARQIDEEAAQRKAALREVLAHLPPPNAQPPAPTANHTPSGGAMSITTTTAARSARGHSRKINQDALIVEPTFAAIADGMGGGPLGERASSVAVEELRRATSEGGTLVEGARRANQRIWQEAQQDARLSGMGTTLVATLIHDTIAQIVNVGDSRTYLLRNDSLRQLTTDDNVVSELIGRGELDPDRAAEHPHRHVLTKVIGIGPEVEPATVTLNTESGDRLLLCTDGITNELSDLDLHRILAGAATPADAIDAIFAASEEAKHADDATAIVIDLT
jgi:PPM family protein phosphatase